MFLSSRSSRCFLPAFIALAFFVVPQLSIAQNRITKVPDLNGDGRSDLIWTNPATGESVAWLMNGIGTSTTAALPRDPSWKIAAAADFNGDGMSDLLWYNPSNGQIIEWLMNGTSVANSTLLSTDPLWSVAEVADLNGDGMADLVLHNVATGQTVAWLMNGTTVTSWSLLRAELHTKVIAAANFNGDTMADLIWYNNSTGETTLSLMNGTTQLGGAVLGTDPNWKLTATADFNGDTMADILWSNPTTGETALWLMNGTTATARVTLQTDPSWIMTATGDLNGDGKADLLWNNPATGQTASWLMNGTNVLSNAVLQTDLHWKVNATADLNGDMKSDILWYNPETGQTSVWLMDGTIGTAGINLFTDPAWRLQCIKSSSLTSAIACSDTDSNASLGNVPMPVNLPPVVYAGSDQAITLPAVASLAGTVTDDGNPIGLVTAAWSLVSGPGIVTFGNATSSKTTATFSLAGTYTLQLTATDSQLSTSNSMVIVVSNPSPSNGKRNQAPVVDAGPDQTISLPSAANLMGSVTDDGMPYKSLLTSWSKVKGGGTVIFANPKLLSTSVIFGAPGTYTLRLTATDGSLSRNDEIVLTVEPPSATNNNPPVVNAGPDQMITLPAAANLAGTVADDGLPTGSTLIRTWSKVSGSGTVTFGSVGSPNTTAAFSVAGSYTLRLTASDGKASTTDDVIIVVSASAPSNKAPMVTAGPDQTVTLPAGPVLTGTATDDGLPTGSTISVSWSKVSGPGTVVFVNVNSINASAAILTAGTYTLRLTASDGTLSSSDDVVITVNPVISTVAALSAVTNAAPAVDAGPDQTITLPKEAVLSGTATDDGLPTGSTISVSWSKVSGPGTVVFANVNSINASAAILTAGTYTLRLTASDGTLSSSDDVIITVSPVISTVAALSVVTNTAPAVDAGSDQTITLPREAVLSGTAIDDGLPSGSSLSKTWTRVSGPSSVSFTNATSLNAVAVFPVAGTYTLRLTVSDGALSSSDDVVITVNPPVPTNAAPVVNAGPDYTVTLPNGITLAGAATDDGLPTGGTLVKTWSKVSGPGTVTFGNAAALNSSANFSTAGTYTLRLTVSDSLLSASDDVVFVVNAAVPANQAPVANAGQDQTITLPSEVILMGSATDDALPSGSSLTKAWSKVSGPSTVSFANAASLNSNAAFPIAGTYTLRLTVSDGALSSSDDVVITVNAAPASNTAPVVNAGPDYTITLPSGITLAGAASDDGLPIGSTLTKAWSKISGPGTVTFGNAAALNSSANFSTAGTYTLRLTASDSLLSTSDDVVFVVNAAPVNQAPVVNAGPDFTITFPNGITLAGSASDDGLPTASTLTKSWSKVSGPGTVTFGSPTALNSTANFAMAGIYTLRLTASDSLLSTSDDVIFTVNAAMPSNLAPLVNAGADQTITLPANVTLVGTTTDDGLPSGALTQTWTKVSGPGTVAFINANSVNASATFTVPGSYTLRLTATDGALTTSDDMVVVVNSCGTVVSQTVTVVANATDNVGIANVQIKVDGVNLGSTITSAPYSLSWNTVGTSNGCHLISVIAQDAAGNQGTAVLSTMVSNP